MIGEFERGQTIDLAVIFVSNVTGELIDPIDPTVEIVHFEGTNEIIDLAETPLSKVLSRPKGHYTYEFTIPSSFQLNELYYVRWRGKDPTPTDCAVDEEIVESHFKVVSPGSTGVGGSGDCCCLVPRFTSC